MNDAEIHILIEYKLVFKQRSDFHVLQSRSKLKRLGITKMNNNHTHTHLQSFNLKSLTIAVLLTLPGTTYATGAFIPLGFLPANNYSSAYAVSADGSVVAGNTNSHAFVWTSGAMTDLGTFGGTYSYANAISANGAAVAGYAYTAGDSTYHAFRWTNGTGLTDLGTLGGTYSYASSISANGAAVAGNASTAGDLTSHAFRWTNGTGMTDLGTLGGTYSYASAISADGAAVAGQANTAGDLTSHAFRWTNGTGMTDLGTLGGTNSYASAISANGAAVAGYAYTAGDSAYHAFRWTNGTGMTDLGTLGGTYSYASAISADGTALVGYSYTAGNAVQLAFHWTQATGMQSIATWLTNAGVTLPAGWVAQNANAVNQNGSVVVGDGIDANGNRQAYLARVGVSNAGVIIDIAAFNSGLIEAGSRYAQAVSALPNLTLFGAHHRSILDNGLARTTDNGTCGWATTDAARNNNIDTRTELVEVGACKDFGSARFGVGIGNAWSQQSLSLDGSAHYDGQYLLIEGAKAFDNGLQPSVTGYFGRFDTKMSRHYMNGAVVDSSNANANTNAYALRARLDWKDAMDIGRFSISPYTAYTWSKAKLDAYTETSGSFPANFAASTWITHDLRVGTAATTALSQDTDLRLGAEVAHRFENNTSGVNGQVVGLWSFALAGQHITQTWTRVTVDVDHRITDKVAFTVGGNAATSGGDANWGVTAGLRASF
jgi:probable HAF family extracellular repeat protein